MAIIKRNAVGWPLPEGKDKYGRKCITACVTDQASRYLQKKRYSVHEEIGVKSWGKRRADIIALNFKRNFIVVEVKSGAADFKADTKMAEYLDSANQMYLAITKKFYESKTGKEAVRGVRELGIGVLVCSNPEDYTATCMPVAKHPAKKRHVEEAHKMYLMTKMAWRGGDYDGSKRKKKPGRKRKSTRKRRARKA